MISIKGGGYKIEYIFERAPYDVREYKPNRTFLVEACADKETIYLYNINGPTDNNVPLWCMLIRHGHLHRLLHEFGIHVDLHHWAIDYLEGNYFGWRNKK